MGKQTIKKRQEVMLKELSEMKEKDYISTYTYNEMVKASGRYYDELLSPPKDAKRDMEKDEHIPVVQEAKESLVTARSKGEEDETKSAELEAYIPVHQEQKTPPRKERLTAQEIRDRNITWSLSIAVILLLIGGTALATNTWDIMSNWMKTGMIALVSLLFFGLAFITERVLDIKKTAFAFYVLGGLFLPIVYLSIGFFEQMGTYLSIYGEGRYLYGAIGSLILFPMYLLLTFKLKARLFVWFTYVTVTLFAGFFIAWFNLPVDGFYLGIMIFNSLLILAYRLLRKKDRLKLITNDLTLYIQANLILSTLLMLNFYSDEVAYGFNIILTAVIYFAMIYVTNNKHYHFVFSAMLVYGAYQVIEFSVLHNIEAVAYALLGFIFLSIPKFIDDKHHLAVIFRYTSAVVSACAFIFISVQGMVIRMDDPSMILLAAYLIIALNFTYLANATDVKNVLFDYLSPIFLMTALFEGVRLGQEIFTYESLVLPMIFGAFIFYIMFGCLMTFSFFQSIKASSRDIAAFVMIICLLIDFSLFNWWESGVMLLILSVTALLMDRFETRPFSKATHLPTWIHPVTLGFAVAMFYTEFQLANVGEFEIDFGPFEPLAMVSASIIVLLISVLWKLLLKTDKFYNHSFFVAQGFYLIGMLGALDLLKIDFNPTTRAVIVLGGIIMGYLLYLKTKWFFMPYVISTVSLIFYMTGLVAIHNNYTINSDVIISLQFPVGVVLLLLIGFALRRFDTRLRDAYWWVGHLYFPAAFIVSLGYGDSSIWSTVLATIVYAVSVLLTTKEWKIKTFLYAGFTSFWLVLTHALMVIDMDEQVHYAWLATSVILTAGWFLSQTAWRARITYYVLPFSLIGAIIFTTISPFDLTLLGVTVGYTALILMILHAVKWDILNILPLTLMFVSVMRFSVFHPGTEYALLLMLAIIFMSIAVLFYPIVYKEVNSKLPILDWYTVAGFIGLFSLYLFAEDILWQKLLPGILIALSIYVQQNRIPSIESRWILFLSIGYLLQPYYALLGHIEVPDLVETECYVLPWIVLAMFLKQLAGEKYQKQMNDVQWVVLVTVSLILIQDALTSNTVYDALIIGSLALASMIGGMAFKQKSFFFVGAGVLLLNLFLQTRPFWGALPWWAYLLIAGSILITVASYNEWHKQKTSKGKETMVSLFNKKIIERIKKWE